MCPSGIPISSKGIGKIRGARALEKLKSLRNVLDSRRKQIVFFRQQQKIADFDVFLPMCVGSCPFSDSYGPDSNN
jgi:hypothetical protein